MTEDPKMAMTPTAFLSPEQVQSFQKDGYAVVRQGDHLTAYYEDKRRSAEPITRKALG